MKTLNQEIDKFFGKIENDESYMLEDFEKDILYPFSDVGIKLAFLLSKEVISYETYIKLSNEYSIRNKFLYLFDLAPRTFGQIWGETHIRNLYPEFVKATKTNLKKLYPDFDGEFDLWYKNLRIEVKACRANDPRGSGSLSSRAFSYLESKENKFKYHFQQLKPSCCDIFIWIGVCKDMLLYWVISSDELIKLDRMGSQHRNENSKLNNNVFEGQVFLTEEELKPYSVEEKDIIKIIEKKYL